METHTHETTATAVRPFRVDVPQESLTEWLSSARTQRDSMHNELAVISQ